MSVVLIHGSGHKLLNHWSDESLRLEPVSG